MELEPLIQKAELDATKFFAGLRDIEAALHRTDRASTATTTRMRSSFQGVVPGINAVRGAIAGLTSVLAVREVLQYADAYTSVQNSLRVAGVATEGLAAATAEVFDIANRTRVPDQRSGTPAARRRTRPAGRRPAQ